jgi:hypothetical protein
MVKPLCHITRWTIVPGTKACAAARKLEDQRFLSRDAPKLPLRNCDYPNCECHYVPTPIVVAGRGVRARWVLRSTVTKAKRSAAVPSAARRKNDR